MKYLRLGIIFIIVCLVFAPVSSAWTWNTHSKIADSVYYSMPKNVQSKLSLSAMRDGSNDPDEKFKDYRRHSFSSSYTQAVHWLNKGTTAYKSKNYRSASKYFGIASHYISDTFSAPHSVSGESSSKHSSYENAAKKLKPTQTTMSGSLYNLMKSGYTHGKSDWKNWLKTKKTYYVQKDLNKATSVSSKAIKNSLKVPISSTNTKTTVSTTKKSTTTYIGNSDSKKLHKANCSYVKRMSSSNKVSFTSRSKAINAGYVPCKICKP